MPQEFQVLRCCACDTFQVHQVKKSKKWNCKMCGQKQSTIKAYGQGSGADCRRHVQKLNMLRGQMDSEGLRAATHGFSDESDQQIPEQFADQSVTDPSGGISNQHEMSSTTASRWQQFIDNDDNDFDQPDEPGDNDHDDELHAEDIVTFTNREDFNKAKKLQKRAYRNKYKAHRNVFCQRPQQAGRNVTMGESYSKRHNNGTQQQQRYSVIDQDSHEQLKYIPYTTTSEGFQKPFVEVRPEVTQRPVLKQQENTQIPGLKANPNNKLASGSKFSKWSCFMEESVEDVNTDNEDDNESFKYPHNDNDDESASFKHPYNENDDDSASFKHPCDTNEGWHGISRLAATAQKPSFSKWNKYQNERVSDDGLTVKAMERLHPAKIAQRNQVAVFVPPSSSKWDQYMYVDSPVQEGDTCDVPGQVCVVPERSYGEPKGINTATETICVSEGRGTKSRSKTGTASMFDCQAKPVQKPLFHVDDDLETVLDGL